MSSWSCSSIDLTCGQAQLASTSGGYEDTLLVARAPHARAAVADVAVVVLLEDGFHVSSSDIFFMLSSRVLVVLIVPYFHSFECRGEGTSQGGLAAGPRWSTLSFTPPLPLPLRPIPLPDRRPLTHQVHVCNPQSPHDTKTPTNKPQQAPCLPASTSPASTPRSSQQPVANPQTILGRDSTSSSPCPSSSFY